MHVFFMDKQYMKGVQKWKKVLLENGEHNNFTGFTVQKSDKWHLSTDKITYEYNCACTVQRTKIRGWEMFFPDCHVRVQKTSYWMPSLQKGDHYFLSPDSLLTGQSVDISRKNFNKNQSAISRPKDFSYRMIFC